MLNEFPDVRLAYGESDEYSFVLGRGTDMYGRRASKIVSLLVSCFTANYVSKWAAFLPDTPLRSTPLFDGRAVCYPLDSNLRVSGATTTRMCMCMCMCIKGSFAEGMAAWRWVCCRRRCEAWDTLGLRPLHESCACTCTQDYLSWRQADTHINNQVQWVYAQVHWCVCVWGGCKHQPKRNQTKPEQARCDMCEMR